MAPLSFEDRAATGRYNELAQLFDGDTESLATVDYETDFKASSRSWRSGDMKNFTTTFSLAQDARRELVVNLIGEVSPEGTELSARGNAWLKADQVITDKTTAKDVLVLNVPTLATPSLKIVWDNQVQTLESVIDADLPVPLVRTPLALFVLSLTTPCRLRRLTVGPALLTTTEPRSSPRFLKNIGSVSDILRNFSWFTWTLL